MDNDNLFNVAFRKFGGLNYSANNNIAHSTYSNATNLLVSNQTGAKNSNIIFKSNADMSDNSFFNIGTAYFDAASVTSQTGALTFNNTSGSTGLNFNISTGTTFRINTTNGSSIAIHDQTISTGSGDLSFTAPSINTIFIDPLLTVPKITTRAGTDLLISTGSSDGHIIADRYAIVDGNITEIGDSLFIGTVGITGSLGVTGPSKFNGTVGITGTLGVTGPSAFYGTVGITGVFGVAGTSSFNNYVGITGALGVTGTADINGLVGIVGVVGVTGTSILNGPVNVSGSFGVTGQSTFDGDVTVTGPVDVVGRAIFNGSVDIIGPVGITGHSTFDTSVHIHGDLNAVGTSIFNGTTKVFGPLDTTGDSSFDGTVNVKGPFGVTGSTTLDGNVGIIGPAVIMGQSTFDGAVGITGRFGVTGSTQITGDLNVIGPFGVTGSASFVSDVGIVADLGITGRSTLKGLVGIIGPFEVSNASDFNGSVGIAGMFGATGTSALYGTIGALGTFGITGPTTLNGNTKLNGDINISGSGSTSIAFNNGIGIEGTLGVTGPTTLNGVIGITGTFGVTGSSTFNGGVTINDLFTIEGSSNFAQDVIISETGTFTSNDVHTFAAGITFGVLPESSNFSNLTQDTMAIKYYVDTIGIPAATLLFNNNNWLGTNIYNTMLVNSEFGVTGASRLNGAVGVIGAIGVTGASTLNGPVGVTGSFVTNGMATLNGPVGITGAFVTTGMAIFNGPLGVTGAFGVTGATILNGPVGVTGSFGVTGESNFNGNATINSGELIVYGQSTMSGVLRIANANAQFNVTGPSTFGPSASNITFGVDGSFVTTGPSTFNGVVGVTEPFGVTGPSTLNGVVGVTGSFVTTGPSTFNGAVGVTGSFVTTGTSAFNGPVGVTGSFEVTGASVFNGTVGVTGALVTTGASTFNGSAGVNGIFGVTGASTLNGSVGVTGAFGVTGASVFNGTAGVSGSFVTTGSSVFNGTVGVTGAFGVTGSSVFNGTLDLIGTSTFNGAVGVTGQFVTTGASVFNGTVGVTGAFVTTGASTLNGTVGVNSLFGVTGASVFNGSVGLTGAFGVTGASVFNGSVGVTGAFGVTGVSVFNGSVGLTGSFGVTGASVFNGVVGVTGSFVTIGRSLFNGSLGVTGSFGATGASVLNGNVIANGSVGITRGSTFEGNMIIRGTDNYVQFPDGTRQTTAYNLTEQHINQDVYGQTCKKSSITYNNRRSITVSHNNMYVMGGQGGGGSIHSLAYSYDGINWIGLGKSIFSNCYAVAWNGQMWVAGGSGTNALAYSYDGINWTGLGTSITSINGTPVTWNNVNAVASDGQMWVAGSADASNTLAYSLDGINWVGLGKIFFNSCNAVAWNGEMWVAGGTSLSGTIRFYIAYSYNGINWFRCDTPDGSVFAVAWNGEMWVAGGNAGLNSAYSDNGIKWYAFETNIFDNACTALATNGQRWVAGGSGANTFAYSDNGIVWVASSPSIISSFNAFAWNGEMWIAGGVSTTNTIVYSYDGITWLAGGTSICGTLNAITFKLGRTNIITISSNKSTSIASSNVVATIDNFVPRQQAYSFGKNIPNMWVAGANAGVNTLAYSYDGINWVGLGTNIFSAGCFGVQWNGTMWVACGGGTNNLAYSYDGITWTGLGLVNSNVNFFGIEWNGTMWVTGGNNTSGNMAYSYDGIIWNSVTTPFGNNVVFCVAWNGLMWLAGSNSVTNTMVYSYDGIIWTSLVILPFTNECRDIKWNGQMWVAVGASYTTNAGPPITYTTLQSTAYSYDGINWSYGNNIFNSSDSSSGQSVEWNGQMWVAGGVGSTNKLAYSYDGIAWTGLGNSIFSVIAYWIKWNGTMWIACGDDSQCTIAYSYNGINWSKILQSANLFTIARCTAFNGARPNTITFPSNNILIGSSDTQVLMKMSNPNALPPSTIVDASQNLADYLSTCNCVNWNGSMWVAVGTHATSQYSIAASTDGIIWAGLDANNTIFSVGKAVAWNGSMWVAVGTDPSVFAYSYDSYSWITPHTNNTNIFTSANAIACNDTRWVAVGTGDKSIAYSDDGIAWTGLDTTIAVEGNAVAWNGYMWVAGFTNHASYNNTLAYSYDGEVWTGLGNSALSDKCLTLDWNGQLWVACGLGAKTIAYSSDGINWNADCTMDTFTVAGYGIAGNNNQFVAVGAGTNTIVSTNTVYTSGNTYTNLYVAGNTFISNSGRSVTYNSKEDVDVKKWVAVGNGAYPISYSENGYAWSGATFIAGGATFSMGYGVASNNLDQGNEKYIAVGVTGSCAIASSTDGSEWTGINYSGSSFTYGYGVACNNNNVTGNDGNTGIKWVAVGKGTRPIAYAELNTGSISFNQTSDISLTNVRGIAYNTNLKRWVAVGNSNTGTSNIAHSTGATAWTSSTGQTFPTQGNAVAANNSATKGTYKFIAVGANTNNNSSNTILASVNGRAGWIGATFFSAGVTGTTNYGNSFIAGNCIACDNYTSGDTYDSVKWVAGGTGTSPIILGKYSLDWNAQSISTSTAINGVGCDKNASGTTAKWVAVGLTMANYSNNGTTWTQISSGLNTGNCVAADLSNNTTYRWIAGGVKSTGIGGFISSRNATTWTAMECISTKYPTSNPLSTVKSIACYYGAGESNNSQAKWVAVCDGSANIISATNTYVWTSSTKTGFSAINGVAATSTRYLIVGNNASGAAVVHSSNGVGNAYSNVTIPTTNTNGLAGMTACNAVAANTGTGTTKFVVVGTGRGSYDTAYSGIAPIYEFDASGNYISGVNGNGYSTYLTNGVASATNGYTDGNAVACDASANAYGVVKWVISGLAPGSANTYVGRFASKWTAGTAGTNFVPADIAYNNRNGTRYVIAGDDGILHGTSLNNLSSTTIVIVTGSSTTTFNLNGPTTCVDTYNGSATTSELFFVGSDDGVYSAYYSFDGINWTTNGAYSNDPSITCVAFNNYTIQYSIYFIIGDASNRLYYHTNITSAPFGQDACTLPSITNLSGIAANSAGNWVAVGTRVSINSPIIYSLGSLSSPGGSITLMFLNSTCDTTVQSIQWKAVASVNYTGSTNNWTPSLSGAKWVVLGNNVSGVTIGYTTTSNGSAGWIGVANSNVFFTNGLAVTCNTNMWIASGTKNAGGYLHFAFSYNGTDWFSLGNFSKTLSSCNSIKYLPSISQIIAVGPAASGTTTNYTVGDMSTNAIAWSRTEYTLTVNTSVACNPAAASGAVRWVVAGTYNSMGAIITSTDGLTWSGSAFNGATGIVTVTGTYIFRSVIYGADKWVAVGNCGDGVNFYSIAYSTNGINWTPVPNSSFLSTYFQSVTWTGAMYVAVGGYTAATYAYSYDGILWFAANVNNNFTAKFISTGPLQNPIVVGSGTNNYTYGTYTTQQSSWSNFYKDANAYNCVACNNGVPTADASNVRWVIVGDASSNYSFQGITFVNTSAPFSAKAVACNNSISTSSVNWVAVGTSGIYWSINGISFTQVTGTSRLSSTFSTIVWNGKTWVAGATGSGCSFAYSYDGKQWFHSGFSSRFSGSILSFATDELYNVVAGSSASPISYGTPATNNITWYSPLSDLSNCEIRGVACNNNFLNNNPNVKWVAVGNVKNSTSNAIIYSSNGVNWNYVTSDPPLSMSTAYAVACNNVANATWVMVGSGTNSIAHSSNGSLWSTVSNSTVANIGTCYGVCYNQTNVQFIAISNSGYATSSNGQTWSYFNNLTYKIFDTLNNSIAYENGISVAVGQDTSTKNTAIGSVDTTISWNNCKNSDLSNHTFYGVACNDGVVGSTIWVAVGTKIVTSTDGMNWNNSSSNSTILSAGYGIAYNPNSSVYWVAVGYHASYSIVYSTDPSGNAWTSVPNSATVLFGTGRAVAWTGSWWVATGDGGTIAYSTNGINWSKFNYNLISGLAVNDFNYISSVKWTGFYWVATGLKNTDSNNNNGCLLYSADGKYWTETLDSKFLTYITRLNTIGWTSNLSNINIKHPIVAVGSGTNSAIAYSIDGYKWINVDAGIFTTGNAVAWNGTMWMAVGQGTTYNIAYSYDGLSWVGLNVNRLLNGKCIAWNGTIWLAGFSDGRLAYSTNGINWNVISSSGLTSCNAIAWNGNVWCAGGNAVVTSPDGLTWTTQTISNFTTCKDIKSNGQMWVAVGTNGIIYSYNGTNWITTSVTSTINVVAWNGKMWVAGGADTTNKLLYSTNGITWIGLSSIFTSSCTALAWTGDKWIAGGLNGATSLFKTSYDGIKWNDVVQKPLTSAINGIAGNSRIGATVVDSQLVLNSGGPGLDNTLDVVSDTYYQSGYTNMETIIYTISA